MGIHYISLAHHGDETHRQTIPAGGNHPLKFPATDKTDPWEMHQSYRDYLNQPEAAVITPIVSGWATLTLDVTWAEQGHTWRYGIVQDTQEATRHSTAASDDPWTHATMVEAGKPLVILLGHDAGRGQEVLAARLQLAIDDSIATPHIQKIRVRAGTDPSVPADNEPPGNPGDDGTPPVIFPE